MHQQHSAEQHPTGITMRAAHHLNKPLFVQQKYTEPQHSRHRAIVGCWTSGRPLVVTNSWFHVMYRCTTWPCRNTSRGTFALLTLRPQQASHAGMHPSGNRRPRQMLLLSMQGSRTGDSSLMQQQMRKRLMLHHASCCRPAQTTATSRQSGQLPCDSASLCIRR